MLICQALKPCSRFITRAGNVSGVIKPGARFITLTTYKLAPCVFNLKVHIVCTNLLWCTEWSKRSSDKQEDAGSIPIMTIQSYQFEKLTTW